MKSLENLLNAPARGELGAVVDRARDMGKLVHNLQNALPADVRPHVRAANLRDNGELVVLVSSPAWAARLRFDTDTLLDAARRCGADAQTCSVRVARGNR